ncbi:hypothetical protein LTR91_002534 [Friedmanniomyces endolithicus]|uniref:Uncharacterized protein n=1 Tax=Friedmanniomyces endolithicus TaxID=329885 RepID=A0AAN6FQP0_9PEZI|nr:hypothetical protein LTS09_009325 [Friedmanniomyces endolithicus]KAK0286241.1 hypothetical protein LTR35_004675 [Friedmanniomyces endolithicus]KAK0299141.1 hypothetical protein LTS00_002251 [Friedmanniomyces endolithicus]KAK0306754.1 hypothetical protein LTR01_006050 [Friedmanniomyces endolithicus]KAK0322759.1 hypothetical protein LTR82_006216 [Friedmanniomyces endolithicus]
MTSFSSLLSSLGDKDQASAPSPRNGPTTTAACQPRPNSAVDRYKLTPSNVVAGVKRRSAEPESTPKQKSIKTEENSVPSGLAAPPNRFQLTAKPVTSRTASSVSHRPATASEISTKPARPSPKQPARAVGASYFSTPPSTSDGAPAKKKSFASILERAKAAQAAAAASSAGGIKHKAVEKLTKKERLRIREEAVAQHKARRRGVRTGERSRSGTPGTGNGAVGGVRKAPAPETLYKGTMKKVAPEQLAWKGTMKAAGSVPKPTPKKGLPQDRYGGYASWSDLDDAEEGEEEDGRDEEYGDESEDDMEGGFDDLEAEESAALAAAKKEDQAALAEEERHKREKLERKRKLMELSKSAAAKKKY